MSTARPASHRLLSFSPGFRTQLQHRLQRPSSPVVSRPRAAASSFSTSSRGSAAKAKGPAKVLEKPDKFRPPSHPQRLRRPSTVRQYGPELTAGERAAQRRKKYPNMMPPEGSLMHWFLTNRSIHMFITLSILAVCGIWSIALNFKQHSPFYDQLPSWGDFLFHPFASIRQYTHVYKLHVEYTSAMAAAKRAKELEEVAKRRAYRIAHGLETADGPGIEPVELPEGSGAAAVVGADGQQLVSQQRTDEVRGPARYKKWFGIW